MAGMSGNEELVRRDAFLNKAIDAFGMYLAGLLSARCSEYVKRGKFCTLTRYLKPFRRTTRDSDTFLNTQRIRYSTEFDAQRPYCRSCGARVQGQVLCDACRRIAPKLCYGPTVVASMFRSSHPRYEITKEKEVEMAKLRKHMAVAQDALMLCSMFATRCWQLQNRCASDAHELNVLFDREMIGPEGNYGCATSCGTEFPVTVGGFGMHLRKRIRELAYEWLKHVDQSVRMWFNISISRTEDEAASVDNCCRRLARLIGDRVSLLDAPHTDQADQHLSSEGCDHLAELQHVRCKYHASNAALNDVTALDALEKLVVDQNKHDTTTLLVVHRAGLVRMLSATPPELLRVLPTVVRDYKLSELRDVLGNQQQYSVSTMSDAVMEWRATVNASALCVLLERARNEANVWKLQSNLLNVIFSPNTKTPDDRTSQWGASDDSGRSPLTHPAARLPAAGWVRGGADWFLIPKQRHAARRTGLDSPGTRIVLLCSIVQRLLAADNAEKSLHFAEGCSRHVSTLTFHPGQIALDVLCPLATAAVHRGAHAYDQLKNQLQPLTIGLEWGATKTELKRWKVSHIDNDVRDAVRHLSDYSVLQMEALFGKSAAMHRTRNAHMPRLLTVVRDRLVVKPPIGYTNFVSEALEWALPIVREYRQSIGFADNARADPIGDLLRLHPAVREWSATDGELRLTMKVTRSCSRARARSRPFTPVYARSRLLTPVYVFTFSRFRARRICAAHQPR